MSLVIHGLLLGKRCTVSDGTTLSTQKLMYPVIQSVRSPMSSPCKLQGTSHSVVTKQPCRARLVFYDQLLTVLVVAGCRWTRGLYSGRRWIRLWSDLLRGGRAVELYGSLTLANILVLQSTNCLKVGRVAARVTRLKSVVMNVCSFAMTECMTFAKGGR